VKQNFAIILLGGGGQVGGATVAELLATSECREVVIFRPGIIVGNAHTPAWVGLLGRLVPGSFGNIDQRSIAAEIALHSGDAGEVVRENAAMKTPAAQFKRNFS
jgi:hypothetical protein